MSKPIPPLDLMFLLTETADSPKHVSALMTFDAAAGAGTPVHELVRAFRAAAPVAPFTYVPEFPLTGAPRWKAASSVDLSRHVHHLALPAGAGAGAGAGAATAFFSAVAAGGEKAALSWLLAKIAATMPTAARTPAMPANNGKRLLRRASVGVAGTMAGICAFWK